MIDSNTKRFSDRNWLQNNVFCALAEIANLLNEKENLGRDALIRVLEHSELFTNYKQIIASLTQKAGLYPYISEPDSLSTADQLSFEFHKVDGLDGIVLHSVQGKIYRALIDGANVILSAPTSFGKSLLIDAMIATRRFNCIVVIVPTIALIDETRRRLSKRFSSEFKVITHPSQVPSDKNIYVLTQERFIEFNKIITPQFFVLDEFYKLSPNRGDDRIFVLNQAFYQLIKSGAQFFLIGPNVHDITIDEEELNFRYFKTDFSTVATEVTYVTTGHEEDNVLAICRTINEPTLIFCKSSASAYKLATYLRSNGISVPTAAATQMASWLRESYHPKWVLADLLDAGFAVHHGALPRSIAYHILRKFDEGAIRFLLCTSTIIEGVNTSAKNIIIYDNKIATKKFDQFTFNNIKGRAGRMYKHFVGRVYVLNAEPEPTLPLVDFPSITQPEDVPESLLIQLDSADLSEHSIEKLRYLHAQDILPIEVMRLNTGLSPEYQLGLAQKIFSNLKEYHPKLAWNGYPKSEQLFTACVLIFDYLMDGHGHDGIGNAKHLYMKISNFTQIKNLPELIQAELRYDTDKSPSDAIESVFAFLRRWGEYNFPKYLSALDNIQRSVFNRAGLSPGNYEVYCAAIKQLFMPLSATILEEYGLPYQITLRIEEKASLGANVDEILANLKKVDITRMNLSLFEQEIVNDTISNL